MSRFADRQSPIPDSVIDLMHQLRRTGASRDAIALELNDRGIATARGGSIWRASSVRAVMKSRRGVARGDMA